VKFDNANGLYEKSEVKMSGLKVGYVKDIQLSDGDILATICVEDKVEISADADFIMKDADQLGTKVVEIKSNPYSQNYLTDGETVYGVYYPSSETDSHSVIDSFVQKVAKPILDTLGYEVTPKKR
jgi:phospholipid/cholesterol/gamma-HCH transport system substrate-binding protein